MKGWFSAQVIGLATLVGALVGLIAGYQTILDFQPFFALKSALEQDQRKDAFNRINDLTFQIDYLQMWDDPVNLDLLRRKVAERAFLECSFQYRPC